MRTDRRALLALTAAGILWGTTVPLSKLALAWLPPGWLTAARFGVAAMLLVAMAGPSRVRAELRTPVFAAGAAGYGGSVLLQNVGITRTSVSDAALLVGAVPVLVAVTAAVWHRSVARPLAWAGFALSLAGVGMITGSHGAGSSAAGNALVLVSVLVSAVFTVGQARLLPGRDPVAVTAVQFLGAAVAGLAAAVLTEGAPPLPARPGAVVVVAALAACGTLAPFTLFAYGQTRVPAVVAGAFVNIEPVVGAVVGVVLFGNPATAWLAAGGTAILAGIAMSSTPSRRGPARQPVACRRVRGLLQPGGRDGLPRVRAGAGVRPGAAAPGSPDREAGAPGPRPAGRQPSHQPARSSGAVPGQDGADAGLQQDGPAARGVLRTGRLRDDGRIRQQVGRHRLRHRERAVALGRRHHRPGGGGWRADVVRAACGAADYSAWRSTSRIPRTVLGGMPTGPCGRSG
jgi:drug/metabolite transporter (DMT)-like permease